MSTWFANNTALDLGKLPKLLGDYIRLKYNPALVNALAIAADPPISDDNITKLIVGSNPFRMQNFFVRIKLNRTPINWQNIRQELYYYEYRVTLECYLRGLAEDQEPDLINLIHNEMQRIFGQYKRYDIPGIEIIQLRELGDLQSPTESGMDGWRYPLDLSVWVFKQNTS